MFDLLNLFVFYLYLYYFFWVQYLRNSCAAVTVSSCATAAISSSISSSEYFDIFRPGGCTKSDRMYEIDWPRATAKFQLTLGTKRWLHARDFRFRFRWQVVLAEDLSLCTRDASADRLFIPSFSGGDGASSWLSERWTSESFCESRKPIDFQSRRALAH